MSLLGVIKEIKESNIKDNGRKCDDKNFEVFKRYNKVLLSYPNAPDPFLYHKREVYRKLQGLEAEKNVFDRLT